MATFITVEQDGSELLRRNREQTQAARLGKLEGDEQARTEQEAKRQRQAELQRQGLDASGNALGDSRRRQPFRRDEPAATLLPYKTFLISWDETSPVFNDPKALIRFNRIPGPYVTAAEINNIPALGVIAPGNDFPGPQASAFAYIRSGRLAKDLQDFTLEAWAQGGAQASNSASNAFIGLQWPLQGETVPPDRDNFCSIQWNEGEPGYPTSIRLDVRSDTEDGINLTGFVEIPNFNTLLPYHICIQRKAGMFYFYLNGTAYELQDYYNPSVTLTPEMARLIQVTPNAEVWIDVGAAKGGNETSRLGQVRFTTGRCRYPIASFTPNPLPLSPQ